MKDIGLTTAMYLVALYFITGQVFMIYFWYMIAQVHGFMYTLFIGPFEAQLKAFVWPFFI